MQNGMLGQLLDSGARASSPGSGPLDNRTMVAGLKEALRVGTERTVAATSRTDGYLGNKLIRIALPSQLDRMGSALRAVGFANQVDRMEVSMNRAAEQAAGEAGGVFLGALKRMTISDAAGILRGGDTAATDYFRAKTSDTLMEKFRPIVSQKMSDVGLYNLYNTLNQRYAALPFVTAPAVNLDEYVSQRALDGLFTVLAQEEGRIREDPAARTTALLRRVFSSR